MRNSLSLSLTHANMRNIPMLNQIQYTNTSKTKTEFNFMEKIKVERDSHPDGTFQRYSKH